jgi:hypothetical protein
VSVWLPVKQEPRSRPSSCSLSRGQQPLRLCLLEGLPQGLWEADGDGGGMLLLMNLSDLDVRGVGEGSGSWVGGRQCERHHL